MPSWQRQHSTYAVGRSVIDGSDALALEAECKWGAGRLRLLVDNDLRARFDSQRLKLNHAIRHGELEDVKREALRMQNAWRALDAAATQAGAAKLSPEVWEEADDNGCVLAVVKTNADAKHVIAEGRHVVVHPATLPFQQRSLSNLSLRTDSGARGGRRDHTAAARRAACSPRCFSSAFSILCLPPATAPWPSRRR
jgi:hypothetical protein